MKTKLRWMLPLALFLVLIAAFLLYTGIYYHADPSALAALTSDETVSVTETGYGWFFDGPSADHVLVFYPGGKVEETAYAPLLHRLAREGMDVCLLKVPFRLAVFDANKADSALDSLAYEYRYVGGHSLGGVMAAGYASEHGEDLCGVILLAAYPTRALDPDLVCLSLYGSEDGVVDPDQIAAARKYMPEQYIEQVLEGGNHAQFGSYGRQRGDGDASLSPEEQQEQTVDFILQNLP
ncbi:MAG: alpha/beta hydrolase [Clostridiales bacterium]|nr:alpha/beta hydrolase [Clostridiales bacterium]